MLRYHRLTLIIVEAVVDARVPQQLFGRAVQVHAVVAQLRDVRLVVPANVDLRMPRLFYLG